MIKKHQKRSIYANYQSRFLKQLLTFETAKVNPNIEEDLCPYNKLLTLFDYWSNQMDKFISAVKIFLLT